MNNHKHIANKIQCLLKLKGNTHLSFLHNHQNSGASGFCTTFPQVTQKIRRYIYMTVIRSFLKILNSRKRTNQQSVCF